MLLELEQECLDIYLSKVEYARKHKADLYLAAFGNRTLVSLVHDTLKEQLSSVKLTFGDLRLKKRKRFEDFSKTESQITRISAEMAWTDQLINNAEPQLNQGNLTGRRLSERKSHLKELQNEKALRLQKIHYHISSLRELSMVMSLGFETTVVADIHPSLVDYGHDQSESIISDYLAKPSGVVKSLKQEKEHSLQKLPTIMKGGKVKEVVGYKVVEVGGDNGLEEKLWEVIRKICIKTKDDKEDKDTEEDKENGEEVQVEAQDDYKHEDNDDEDVIQVFVEVIEKDAHTTLMAEVRVGSLSRKVCQALQNFMQLEALVKSLVEKENLLPLLYEMSCQTLTSQERYMDLPTEYHDIVKKTSRILVRESQDEDG